MISRLLLNSRVIILALAVIIVAGATLWLLTVHKSSAPDVAADETYALNSASAVAASDSDDNKLGSAGQSPGQPQSVTQAALMQDAAPSVSALYNAASVADLVRMASAFDAHDPDAFAIVRNAESFCGFARSLVSPALDGKPRMPDTPEALRSLQLVADFVASYCNGPMPNSEVRGLAHEIQDQLIAETQDADYRRVLELEAGYSATMPDADRASAAAELAEIMARTQSPEVLSTAGNSLASGRFGDWALGRNLVAWTPFEGRTLELQSAAVVLAQCRLARSCGPNTLTVIQMCAPSLCTPGMSAEDYFRRIFSADEFAILLRMRAEIERARSGGG